MIDWISIKNFAIAESVELELEAGFTAVTGETGSGKSIMVDAIATLLGARADNSMILHGQSQAEISCSFELPNTHPVFSLLAEFSLDQNQELLIRRVIRRDKPGRGFVNGKATNISTLKLIGETLVDIHGQHEHHSLMRRPVQLALIDQASDNSILVQQLSGHYDQYVEVKDRLIQLSEQQSHTQERIDLVTFQLGELEALRPVAGEWEKLERRHKRMQHANDLLGGCQEVLTQLSDTEQSGSHSELVRLAGKIRQLSSIAKELSEVADLMDEAAVNIDEACRQLQVQLDQVDNDPEEFVELESRISSYHDLARKHRVKPDQLAEHTEHLRSQLENLENPEAERIRLESELEEIKAAYTKIAAQVSRRRKAFAEELGKKTTDAMEVLGMEGGSFEVSLLPVKPGEFTRYGFESVEYLVRTNPGQPTQPLAKIASGGEVSRISLAIQVILASQSDIPTLIFDEVDVGIGGTVANTVGQQLRQLGETCQVLCVTHLSQVAARANTQYSVVKYANQRVGVEVKKLDREQRVEEIARMSGSDKLTAQSRAHAEQLLAAG